MKEVHHRHQRAGGQPRPDPLPTLPVVLLPLLMKGIIIFINNKIII